MENNSGERLLDLCRSCGNIFINSLPTFALSTFFITIGAVIFAELNRRGINNNRNWIKLFITILQVIQGLPLLFAPVVVAYSGDRLVRTFTSQPGYGSVAFLGYAFHSAFGAAMLQVVFGWGKRVHQWEDHWSNLQSFNRRAAVGHLLKELGAPVAAVWTISFVWLHSMYSTPHFMGQSTVLRELGMQLRGLPDIWPSRLLAMIAFSLLVFFAVGGTWRVMDWVGRSLICSSRAERAEYPSNFFMKLKIPIWCALTIGSLLTIPHVIVLGSTILRVVEGISLGFDARAFQVMESLAAFGVWIALLVALSLGARALSRASRWHHESSVSGPTLFSILALVPPIAYASIALAFEFSNTRWLGVVLVFALYSIAVFTFASNAKIGRKTLDGVMNGRLLKMSKINRCRLWICSETSWLPLFCLFTIFVVWQEDSMHKLLDVRWPVRAFSDQLISVEGNLALKEWWGVLICTIIWLGLFGVAALFRWKRNFISGLWMPKSTSVVALTLISIIFLSTGSRAQAATKEIVLGLQNQIDLRGERAAVLLTPVELKGQVIIIDELRMEGGARVEIDISGNPTSIIVRRMIVEGRASASLTVMAQQFGAALDNQKTAAGCSFNIQQLKCDGVLDFVLRNCQINDLRLVGEQERLSQVQRSLAKVHFRCSDAQIGGDLEIKRLTVLECVAIFVSGEENYQNNQRIVLEDVEIESALFKGILLEKEYPRYSMRITGMVPIREQETPRITVRNLQIDQAEIRLRGSMPEAGSSPSVQLRVQDCILGAPGVAGGTHGPHFLLEGAGLKIDSIFESLILNGALEIKGNIQKSEVGLFDIKGGQWASQSEIRINAQGTQRLDIAEVDILRFRQNGENGTLDFNLLGPLTVHEKAYVSYLFVEKLAQFSVNNTYGRDFLDNLRRVGFYNKNGQIDDSTSENIGRDALYAKKRAELYFYTPIFGYILDWTSGLGLELFKPLKTFVVYTILMLLACYLSFKMTAHSTVSLIGRFWVFLCAFLFGVGENKIDATSIVRLRVIKKIYLAIFSFQVFAFTLFMALAPL